MDCHCDAGTASQKGGGKPHRDTSTDRKGVFRKGVFRNPHACMQQNSTEALGFFRSLHACGLQGPRDRHPDTYDSESGH